MRQRWFWLLVLTIASSARAADPVTIEEVVLANPPQHLHIAKIDLRDPAVSVHVIRAGGAATKPSRWQTTLDLPTIVSQREKLSVAVNGDFFMADRTIDLFGKRTPYFVGNLASVCGWAMSDGALWSTTPAAASLIEDQNHRVRIGRLDRVPADAHDMVSGSSMILQNGRNVAPDGGRDGEPYPRTAAGIDAMADALVLVVVDGHRPRDRTGMTLRQLGDQLIQLGCSDALNLDGGGSSVMVADGKLISLPSDGRNLPLDPIVQRPVACVVGIRVDKR
ncbi:MAG: phosphodiester glycosidase family protein [Phycisphaerae bacterium]|nr:phosphodiester glycosidase family protein [Phycisphaerae bacterium]